MGAARIVEHLGEGLYRIERVPRGLDGELAYLAARRTILEAALPKWRNAVAQQWDEAQVLRQTLNALIEDWASGDYLPDAVIPSATTPPSADDKTEVVRLVNEIRADNGLPPLSQNEALATAAQDHSDWMGANQVSHDGANGSKPKDRVSAAGYDYSTVAENVAAGQTTPQQVVDAWMASPGHRANILNPDVKEIGVGGGFGEKGRTWTQNFGAQDGG